MGARRLSSARRGVLLAACGALVALPAAGGARPAARAVRIAGFAFAPATVAAAVGDTIIWQNDDIAPHTATAADSSWDSGVLAPGASWRTVLRARGEIEYVCALHPSMRGKISVR